MSLAPLIRRFGDSGTIIVSTYRFDAANLFVEAGGAQLGVDGRWSWRSIELEQRTVVFRDGQWQLDPPPGRP